MYGIAERARAQIEALATTGLDVPTFGQAACDVLTRAVPFSATCLAPVDPTTLLVTGNVKWRVGDDHDEQWAHYEYEGPDLYNFQTVAARPGGASTAHMETGGDTNRSARFTELYRPIWGIRDEARIPRQTDGNTWGFLALFRDELCSAFTAAEQEYLSGVRAGFAVGLRAGMLASAATDLLPAANGPIVLVVDAAGEIVQASVGAAGGIADLGGGPIGQSPLPQGLRTLVGAARQFAIGNYPAVPRMRIRTRSGHWVVAHASPLLSRDDAGTDVVVTLEEARPPEIVPLVVAAFGLTLREHDVVALVLQGINTGEVARTLRLSSYTVQDPSSRSSTRLAFTAAANSPRKCSTTSTPRDWRLEQVSPHPADSAPDRVDPSAPGRSRPRYAGHDQLSQEDGTHAMTPARPFGR